MGDIVKNVLSHGGEETTDQLLILIILGCVSWVGDELGASSNGQSHLFGLRKSGSIKVSHEVDAPEIGQELGMPE
jgi:hypothetical protein